MSTKANLTELLAETSGSARHKKTSAELVEAPKQKPTAQKSRAATSPITVHFPKEVRDQLKILAVNNGNTLHGLVAEAFNDLFAKYGKPEIAPAQPESRE